jgi:hypothetical protein
MATKDNLAVLGRKLQDALTSGDIPMDAEIIIGRLLKQSGALQRIANLPMSRRKGQPDPHLRARRIAVAALGGNPQKITTK